MKSKIIEEKAKEPEIKYPCLMADGNKKVFFMTSKHEGFLIYQEGEGSYPLGDEAEGWGIGGFSLFNGKIELSND